MSRPRKFPIEIKAGSASIKIYLSPVKVTPKSDSNAGALQSVIYDSFIVVHYRAGKRYRQRFKTLDLAQDEANRIKSLLLKEDSSGADLLGKDLLAYNQANHVARKFNLSLDALVNEYSSAREILGSVGIVEAARFYQRFGQVVQDKKTVPEVVAELLAGLKADNKSEYHYRDMDRRLNVFAQDFPGFIIDIHTKAITDWVRKVKGKDQQGKDIIFVAKTRNHYRNAVAQLFNYARSQGYLPKGLPTEVEGVKVLDVIPPANEIFTPDEMVTLLSNAPDHLVAALAIKAFSGVRTEEMVRMEWGAVNFETKHIALSAQVTKTKLRRIIPMSDNLVAWLTPFKKRTGLVSARWVTPQTLVQAFDRYGKQHDIHVGANKFRNSYITYRVAVTHDVQRVALESGNSPRVIQREYLELATEDAGKRWFNIFPVAADAGKPAVEAK